jgi:hypothetical protein
MESIGPSCRNAEFPLPEEAQRRLDQFKAFSLRHPLLDQVETQLLHAIWEPAGFAYVIVFGPSGVGKSTMIEILVNHFNAARALSFGSLLLTEVRPPEGELFDRADYYHTTFQKLGIHTQSASEKRERGNRSPRYHEDPALRNALEETLKRQHVRAVFLDEAQHLMKASNGAKPRDQLDWIKSMTNVSGVLHVLLGTYDLLHFCNLDGQSARRGLEIHFPRYNFQDKDEREAFQAALLSLLRQVPLQIDEQALMNGWWEFYKRSIGCVGVLKQWLVRATALALREESEKLGWTHLERRALSDAKCAQMAADVKDGEDELRYAAETNRERLSRVFGVGDVPRAIHPDPQEKPSGFQSEVQDLSSKKGPQRRVGERAPQRDPVGETPTALPSSPTCSFKGSIDISPEQMKETGISLVECPDCAGTRSLPFSGRTIRFPSHPKRKTSTPNEDERWVKRNAVWKLASTC